MITKQDIIKEAHKRYPESKPRLYLTEGQRLGFVKGALWMKQLLSDKGWAPIVKKRKD
jgi:hypothetical protein